MTRLSIIDIIKIVWVAICFSQDLPLFLSSQIYRCREGSDHDNGQ